jgi:hypothetical protein
VLRVHATSIRAEPTSDPRPVPSHQAIHPIGRFGHRASHRGERRAAGEGAQERIDEGPCRVDLPVERDEVRRVELCDRIHVAEELVGFRALDGNGTKTI